MYFLILDREKMNKYLRNLESLREVRNILDSLKVQIHYSTVDETSKIDKIEKVDSRAFYQILNQCDALIADIEHEHKGEDE